MIDQPLPFEEAILYILRKEPNPKQWDSAMWAAEKPGIRTRSFISANVESARFLDRAQGLIFDFLAGVRDDVVTRRGEKTTALRVGGREDFVMLMREFMIAEGMASPEEFAGVNQNDLTDIRSMARLRLIFDTSVRQAYGYGNWRQGITPAVKRAFPAARLVRRRGVSVPRPRHEQHEGEIRQKDDTPWWARYINSPDIGGFGVPWGPYGFNSGMEQEDVSREELERLGIDFSKFPSQWETPSDESGKPFGANSEFTQSIRNMDEDVKKKLIERLRAQQASSGPSTTDRAREGAKRARRASLERSLARAERDGNQAEIDKIRDLMTRDENQPAGTNIVIDADEIRIE